MIKRICNYCGKDFDFWDEQEDFSIHRHAGYGTEFDGSQIDLDLCCECMSKIIKQCCINPIADDSQ